MPFSEKRIKEIMEQLNRIKEGDNPLTKEQQKHFQDKMKSSIPIK